MAAAPGRTAHQPTARELVEGIAEEHGIVSESDLTEIGAMNQRIRSVVEKALLQKDQLIGSSILTLAKNLNTSHARFVFELLQNADDNKFVVANSRGVEPFVKFSVYRERIKIECNEDGFTYHDLKAICAIGQSSKNRSHGYIGEKGIGFKSVFMAAYKVNILSNDFSFSFTHRKGDSGLGMVTPIWEPDFIPQCEQASSSITLHLHQYDDTSLSEAARQREEINREFENLPITVLLFLRNLRRIEIQFHDDNDTETKRVEYSFSTLSSSTLIERVWLSDRESSSGETVQRKHHVTRQVIRDAPPNENRELSEGNGRADAETEVILAFPLTDDYTPIIDNQPVFAFLPMMPLGFKPVLIYKQFIIQADFVTNSSREGIVISSARNLAIRNGIATCFLKAVEEMCQHPMLQFQWMRWLPQRHSYPWDSFWSGLLEDIVSRIKTSKILRTRGSGHLGGIHSLRRLQSNWLDEAGTPLFDDLDAEIYVAEEYQVKDLSLLEPYGLKWLSADDRLARIEHDLGQPIDKSRMKNLSTSPQWHSRAASMIQRLVATASSQGLARIRTLDIIPLRDGSWTSINRNKRPIYFPYSGDDLEIPADLPLSLVSPEASAVDDRYKLFELLGVQTATVEEIQQLIFEAPIPILKTEATLLASVSNLKFLYSSHHDTSHDVESSTAIANLFVFDRTMEVQLPHRQDVYLATSGPYEPRRLLQPTATHPDGCFVSFLHDQYSECPPETPAGLEQTWSDWLQRVLQVRRRLRLTSSTSPESLSPELNYVRLFRPESFIEALQHHWMLLNHDDSSTPKFLRNLRDLNITCKDGRDYPLAETTLPLLELQAVVSSYLGDSTISFLQIDEAAHSVSYHSKWGFLVNELGVRARDDVNLYLSILEKVIESQPQLGNYRKILGLYEMIQLRYEESASKDQVATVVRNFCRQRHCILVPIYNNQGEQRRATLGITAAEDSTLTWRRPDTCVWAAPGVPYAYTALEGQLTNDCSEDQAASLERFMKLTLGVGDWDEDCCIQELKHMKGANCDDFDWVVEIYDFLHNCDVLESQLKDFRILFRTTPLIFVPNGETFRWCTTAECLWSSGAKIQGRTTLSSIYEDLEDFFVETLGVQRLTLAMACDELLKKGTEQTAATIAEVKETIWAVNTLLQTATLYPDPEQLLESAIFPVEYPNGQVCLETFRTHFVIRDRKPLAAIFASKVKFLDFSLDEVHRLSNFFSWLGLDSRYLSSSVKEISTVASDSQIRVQRPDRDIRRRAGGISRVASHFNSPRSDDVHGLYHTLRATEVFETHGISSEIHLVQDGKAHIHAKSSSELHIREAAGRLQIYVPLSKERQDFCYHSSLPRRLLEWVMTEPETQICGAIPHRAISAMSSALNAPIQSVSQILEAEGIIDLGGINEDDQGQEFEERSDASPPPVADSQRQGFAAEMPMRPFSLTGSRLVSGPAVTYPTFTQQASTPASPDRNRSSRLQPNPPVDAATANLPPDIFHFGQTSTAPTATTSPRFDAFSVEYLRILNNVIFSAQRRSFPDFDPTRTGQSAECVSSPSSNPWIPSGSDKNIGAAGELFVYELLSHLNPSLPGFGLDNWQSTMRKYVAVHPEYSYVTPWEGQETADIVYDDRFGVLTEILIEKGYLERTKWIGKKPQYLIEVKTTPGDAARPFFVSKYQYNRMRSYTDASTSPGETYTVYMLLRVFNLTTSDIDFNVYMDPYALQQDGTLVFTEHTWQVIPVQGNKAA
ncbi:hypothetical protein CMEL01_11133 [Colletotrichum melonis]|uniref:Protein NO VEIN C-terminal domain-containing protein n=1 Tax=Colletotrichum melonis TaxID=1209925 RepID=A0AAI9V0T5_9PEZI|nr:hypothetical protein CMEL01_11133 [Colletotrichum melonis]